MLLHYADLLKFEFFMGDYAIVCLSYAIAGEKDMTKTSNSPVPLYYPLNTLKAIEEDIWIVDGGLIRIDMKIGKLPFSTRMTIIRLENGDLWCHSPIAPDEGLVAQIDALGTVQHLVSPNMIHYAYIADWKKLYPQATAWASPKVSKRAKAQHISVTFDRELTDTAPAEWAGQIEQLIFQGSRVLSEVVFFHRTSRTLILTDLIENFATEKVPSYPLRMLMKLAGIADPDGKTPLDFRLTFWGNKAQARQSYTEILAWQPEKIILAHGRCYTENAMAELQRAFRWLK